MVPSPPGRLTEKSNRVERRQTRTETLHALLMYTMWSHPNFTPAMWKTLYSPFLMWKIPPLPPVRGCQEPITSISTLNIEPHDLRKSRAENPSPNLPWMPRHRHEGATTEQLKQTNLLEKKPVMAVPSLYQTLCSLLSALRFTCLQQWARWFSATHNSVFLCTLGTAS